MKFTATILLSLLLTTACAKRESTPNLEPGPNTSAGKTGSEAGTGSAGSLGSEHPSNQ